MQPYLALPIDVVRKFNPQVSQSDIQGTASTKGEAQQKIIGNDDYNQILNQIETVESTLRNRYGKGHKEAYAYRVTPNDYVEKTESFAFPRLWVDLPHTNVVSIDQIEIRTGGDSDDWEVINTDEYTLDNRDGTLIIQRFRWLSDLYDHPGNSIRLNYSHGALGWEEDMAGEAELTAQTGTGTGTWDIDDASNFQYRNPTTFQVDGEYVIGEVDVANNQIQVTKRGWRGTSDENHASGETVHYCPMDVRDGVAAKVAMWLANSAVKLDQIAGESMTPGDRMDQWQKEWDELTSGGQWHSI